MGILSRLFSKEDEEALTQLEKHFKSVLIKSHSDWISLVGLKGKTKGLDIVNHFEPNGQFDRKDLQRINGRLVELYTRYQSLEFPRNPDSPPLQVIIFHFSEEEQICVFPIEGNDQFIISAQTSQPARILKNLIKFRIDLYKLRLERAG